MSEPRLLNHLFDSQQRDEIYEKKVTQFSVVNNATIVQLYHANKGWLGAMNTVGKWIDMISFFPNDLYNNLGSQNVPPQNPPAMFINQFVGSLNDLNTIFEMEDYLMNHYVNRAQANYIFTIDETILHLKPNLMDPLFDMLERLGGYPLIILDINPRHGTAMSRANFYNTPGNASSFGMLQRRYADEFDVYAVDEMPWTARTPWMANLLDHGYFYSFYAGIPTIYFPIVYNRLGNLMVFHLKREGIIEHFFSDQQSQRLPENIGRGFEYLPREGQYASVIATSAFLSSVRNAPNIEAAQTLFSYSKGSLYHSDLSIPEIYYRVKSAPSLNVIDWWKIVSTEWYRPSTWWMLLKFFVAPPTLSNAPVSDVYRTLDSKKKRLTLDVVFSLISAFMAVRFTKKVVNVVCGLNASSNASIFYPASVESVSTLNMITLGYIGNSLLSALYPSFYLLTYYPVVIGLMSQTHKLKWAFSNLKYVKDYFFSMDEFVAHRGLGDWFESFPATFLPGNEDVLEFLMDHKKRILLDSFTFKSLLLQTLSEELFLFAGSYYDVSFSMDCAMFLMKCCLGLFESLSRDHTRNFPIHATFGLRWFLVRLCERFLPRFKDMFKMLGVLVFLLNWIQHFYHNWLYAIGSKCMLVADGWSGFTFWGPAEYDSYIGQLPIVNPAYRENFVNRCLASDIDPFAPRTFSEVNIPPLERIAELLQPIIDNTRTDEMIEKFVDCADDVDFLNRVSKEFLILENVTNYLPTLPTGASVISTTDIMVPLMSLGVCVFASGVYDFFFAPIAPPIEEFDVLENAPLPLVRIEPVQRVEEIEDDLEDLQNSADDVLSDLNNDDNSVESFEELLDQISSPDFYTELNELCDHNAELIRQNSILTNDLQQTENDKKFLQITVSNMNGNLVALRQEFEAVQESNERWQKLLHEREQELLLKDEQLQELTESNRRLLEENSMIKQQNQFEKKIHELQEVINEQQEFLKSLQLKNLAVKKLVAQEAMNAKELIQMNEVCVESLDVLKEYQRQLCAFTALNPKESPREINTILADVQQRIKRLTFKEQNDIQDVVMEPKLVTWPDWLRWIDYQGHSVFVINGPASCGKTHFLTDFLLTHGLIDTVRVIVPTVALQAGHADRGYPVLVNRYERTIFSWIDEFYRFSDDFIQGAIRGSDYSILTGDIHQYTPLLQDDAENKVKEWSYKISPVKMRLTGMNQFDSLEILHQLHRFNYQFAKKIIATFYPNRATILKISNNVQHSFTVMSCIDFPAEFLQLSWIVLVRKEIDLVKNWGVTKVYTPLSAQGIASMELGSPVILFTNMFCPKISYIPLNLGLLNDKDLQIRESQQSKILTWLTRSSTKTILLTPHVSSWQYWDSQLTREVQLPIKPISVYQKIETLRRRLPTFPNEKFNIKFQTLTRVTLQYFFHIYKTFPLSVCDFTADRCVLINMFVDVLKNRNVTFTIARKHADVQSPLTVCSEKFLPDSAIDSPNGDIAIVDCGVCESFSWKQYLESIAILQRKFKMILIKGWSQDEKIMNSHVIPTNLIHVTKTEFHQLILPQDSLIHLTEHFMLPFVSRMTRNTNKLSSMGTLVNGKKFDFYGPHVALHTSAVAFPFDQEDLRTPIEKEICYNLRHVLGYSFVPILPCAINDQFPTFGWWSACLFSENENADDKLKQLALIIGGVEPNPGPQWSSAQWVEHRLKLKELLATRNLINAQVHFPHQKCFAFLKRPLDLPIKKTITADSFTNNMSARGVMLIDGPYVPTAYMNQELNAIQAACFRLNRNKNPNPNFLNWLSQIPIQAYYDFWDLPNQVDRNDIVSLEAWWKNFPGNRAREFKRSLGKVQQLYSQQIVSDRMTMPFMPKWDETLLADQTYQKEKRSRGICIPPAYYLTAMGPVVTTIQNHFQRHLNFESNFYFACGANPLMTATWSERAAMHYPLTASMDISSMDASYFAFIKSLIIQIMIHSFHLTPWYQFYYDLFHATLSVRIVNMGYKKVLIFEIILNGVLCTGELFTLLMNSILSLLFCTWTLWTLGWQKTDAFVIFIGDDHKVNVRETEPFLDVYYQILAQMDFSATGEVTNWEDAEFCSCYIYKIKPVETTIIHKGKYGDHSFSHCFQYIYDWKPFRALKCLNYSTTNPVPLQEYIPQLLKSLSFHSSVPVFKDYYIKLVQEWGCAPELAGWFLRKFPEHSFKMVSTIIWQMDENWWQSAVLRRHGDLTFKMDREQHFPAVDYFDEFITVNGPATHDTVLNVQETETAIALKSLRVKQTKKRAIEKDYSHITNVLNAAIISLFMD